MPKTRPTFRVEAAPSRDHAGRWVWTISREDAATPVRRSPPLFTSEADAVEAGRQVADAMRRPLGQERFRPGF